VGRADLACARHPPALSPGSRGPSAGRPIQTLDKTRSRVWDSHGQHCYSTLSLAVICSHCLGLHTDLAVIAVNFSPNDSVAPIWDL
jgi:hypothetical protein